MDYLAILKRAFRITCRYRALWLFGILLALFGGGGGGGGDGSSGGGGDGGSSFAQLLQILRYQLNNSDLERFSRDWALGPGAIAAIILGIVLFIVALIVLSVIIRYVCIGALIGMVDDVERTETTSIGSGFRIGWARFLRLFAISLVLGIPTAAILLGALLIALLPLPIVILGITGREVVLIALGILGMIGLFLLWILVALVALVVGAVVSVLTKFMHRRCVLAGEGVLESVREGFWMVRRNIRDASIIGLLLFGIELVLSIVLITAMLVGMGIVAGLVAASWFVTRAIIAAIGTGLPALLLLIAALTLLQGLVIVFRSAVWTLVYREMDGGAG